MKKEYGILIGLSAVVFSCVFFYQHKLIAQADHRTNPKNFVVSKKANNLEPAPAAAVPDYKMGSPR